MGLRVKADSGNKIGLVFFFFVAEHRVPITLACYG